MAGQGGQEGEIVTQNTHLLMLVNPKPVQGLTLIGPSKAAPCLALRLDVWSVSGLLVSLSLFIFALAPPL